MEKLYFRQLLAGRDFALTNRFAGQMENFVYLIGDREKKECLIVDPAWDISGIVDIAQKDGMKIVGALATHYHPDHVGGTIFGHFIEGAAELVSLAHCPIHAHKLECEGIRKVTGLSKSDVIPHESGDIVRAGDIEVQFVHTPGHTPGSCCFQLKNALVSGDTIFLTGCGRVDLPGGDVEEMYRTINSRLKNIPDETVVYPGHAYGGEHANMHTMRSKNRAFQFSDLASFKKLFS